MPAGDWIADGFTGLIDAGDKAGDLARRAAGRRTWTSRPTSSTSRFVNYYIHQVNLMRHLLGEPYKVTYADKTGVLLAVQSD